nr:MAG TPA: hypothetical protein [Caudoviricetes sp.]
MNEEPLVVPINGTTRGYMTSNRLNRHYFSFITGILP